MSGTQTKVRDRSQVRQTAGGGGAYLLCMIGALVFFWIEADSFGGRVAALFKALVWPAFLVYGALGALFGQ